MIRINDLKNNNNFYIDEFNLKRITNSDIVKYKIIDIPLKKIKMYINNKFIPLEKTVAYDYLNNKKDNYDEYKNYCIKYGKNNPNRNVDSYNRLMNEFKEYDIKHGAIIIDQHNILKDGQHRCCLLLKKYGKDYKIKVLKIYYYETKINKLKNIIKLIIMR